MTTITIPRVMAGSDEDTPSRDGFEHIAGLKFRGRPLWSGASESSGSSPPERPSNVDML